MLWLRWVKIGLLVAISSTPTLAAPNTEHRAQAEHHRRIAKPPKNPAPHAKVAHKKKRPTEPHQKKPIAKQHKATSHDKHLQKGERSMAKAHNLPVTQSHKANPESEARHANRVEPEKPRDVSNRDETPKNSRFAAPAPPKEPEAPVVQKPKEPSVE